MPYDVLLTPVSRRQRDSLRGPVLKAYEQFVENLAANGCAALSYRLTGPSPLSDICVKHLRGQYRVLVLFTDLVAWVLLIGSHTSNRKTNIYDSLYEVVGFAPQPASERTKPSCCAEDGVGPVQDEAVVEELVSRARKVLRPQ